MDIISLLYYMKTFSGPRATFKIKVFKFIFLSIASERVSCFNEKPFLIGMNVEKWREKSCTFYVPKSFGFWEHLSANMIFRNKKKE